MCSSQRELCELVLTSTHILAIGVDVDGPNRPFHHENHCKELSHLHSSIVQCDRPIRSCAQLEIFCNRAETPTNLTTARIGIDLGATGEICARAKAKPILHILRMAPSPTKSLMSNLAERGIATQVL